MNNNGYRIVVDAGHPSYNKTNIIYLVVAKIIYII